jgi:hypothetical protein
VSLDHAISPFRFTKWLYRPNLTDQGTESVELWQCDLVGRIYSEIISGYSGRQR